MRPAEDRSPDAGSFTEYVEPESSRASSALRELVKVATPTGANDQDTLNASRGSNAHGSDPDGYDGLSEGLRTLSVDSPTYRYHGKQSTLVFIRAVQDLKSRTLGPESVSKKPRRFKQKQYGIPVRIVTSLCASMELEEY